MAKRVVGLNGVRAAVAAAVLATAPALWAADADLARVIEAAKQEGEVHYIDAVITTKTHAGLERAFRKKYGLPDSFKITHTLQGTGQVLASVQQEIKAGQHTFDLVWLASPSFFRAAAKDGHFISYVPAEWKQFEREVKRLNIEADPPNWISPVGYAFVPVWNRKCPGFADVRITSWKDLLNPAFKGKLILSDVRKSLTYTVSWVGMEGTLGKDFFPKLVEVTQPAIFFRTEEVMQKTASCEYPIAVWQLPGRVHQRMQEDSTGNFGIGWPQEGLTVMGVPIAILKGSKRPNAAKLFMEFVVSEEGIREYVAGESVIPFRDGFKVPEAVKAYVPALEQLKALPVNWPALTLGEIKKVQDNFRRILKVD